jgi:hypothetical protein
MPGFKMDEENLEKKDLKYVRQSMYRERRKLHPAQPKNQAEFHSIFDDIGKFSSFILKSSELMIFEGSSDIISTAFLLQAVLKICRSSFCAFFSCILTSEKSVEKMSQIFKSFKLGFN